MSLKSGAHECPNTIFWTLEANRWVNAKYGFLNISDMDHVIEAFGKPVNPFVKRRGISILVKLYSWYIRSLGSCKFGPRSDQGDWMNEGFVCGLGSCKTESLKKAPTYCQAPTSPNKKQINPCNLLTRKDIHHIRTFLGQHFGLPKAFYIIGTMKIGRHGGHKNIGMSQNRGSRNLILLYSFIET